MKRIVKLVLSFLFILTVVGCSQNSLTGKEEVLEGGEYQNIDNTIDLFAARSIAENFIRNRDINEWVDAQITDEFFIYNHTIKGPAFVEYKITKNGYPRGYIMVSLTENHYPVPEFASSGYTNTELLQYEYSKIQKRSLADFTYRVYRFNFLTFSMEDSIGNLISGTGELEDLNLSEINRSGSNSSYNEFVNQYKILIDNNEGCLAMNRTQVEEYYNKTRNYDIKRGNVSYADMPDLFAEVVTDETHPDPEKSTQSKLYLPEYEQFDMDSSDTLTKSGCSPTASAMILAYWYLKKGKTKLFDGEPIKVFYNYKDDSKDYVFYQDIYSSTDQKLKATRDAILDLRTLMKTTRDDKGGGSTTVFNAWVGTYQYIWNRGYHHGVYRYYNGLWASNEWNTFYNEIKNGRPMLLTYNRIDSNGEKIGHSIAVWGVRITRIWTGSYGNCYFYANNGHRNGSVWINKNFTTDKFSYLELVTIDVRYER